MRSPRFQALVDQQPENVMFRFSLGQAFLEEGRAAEAVAHLAYCVRQRDDWMMARILLGRALRETGDLPAAREALAAALQLAIAQHHEEPEAELRAMLAGFDPAT